MSRAVLTMLRRVRRPSVVGAASGTSRHAALHESERAVVRVGSDVIHREVWIGTVSGPRWVSVTRGETLTSDEREVARSSMVDVDPERLCRVCWPRRAVDMAGAS